MSVTPTEQFVSLLKQSNLLTAEQLQAARVVLATADVAQLPLLVESFAERGWMTRWQGRMLLAGRHAFFLGRYKLLDHLGEGGMGSVLKAEQTPLGRLVAIKTLRKDLVSSPEMVARFHREIQAAAALSHPNIVAAYDADEVAGRHFLVMEYVEGRDLSQLVKGGKQLPVGAACEYIRQAALGLEHAHERGMVHRDIKPSNLLLDTAGHVKILDMGLARIVAGHANEQTELTHTGQVVGTPDYISPEQARDTKSADIRSDVYSLGCSLYRLLTGRVPFAGDGAIAKITARLVDDVPQLCDARPGAPAELETVLLKMMARDVEQRYQTPSEVVRALTPFADVGAAHSQVGAAAGQREPRSLKETGFLPAPELNDFLNQLADEAAHDAEVDTGTQELDRTEASGGRQPADALAPTMVFDPESNQPADTGRSPKISRAGRKLQDDIAARKQADRRKLLIGAAVVAAFIAVVVGVFAWQQAGETTLIVDWPLDERDGATIEIDGRAAEITQQARLRFSGPPGQRTLKLSRDGFEPIEDSFELGRGETETFRPAWVATAETARQQQLAALAQRVNAFRQASRGVHPPGPDGGDQPRHSPNDAEVVSLRSELVEFHREHFATPAAVETARQMSRLPWPMDRLQKADVTEYENRIAGIGNIGKSPELVAVFGDSRLKHWGDVFDVVYSPDGRTIYSCDIYGVIKGWDTVTFQETAHAFLESTAVRDIAISPDGKWLAACGSGRVTLLNLPTMDAPSPIYQTGALTGGVDFSPDSQFLAAGTSNGNVLVCSVKTKKPIATLKGHTGAIADVAFSPSGKLLASTAVDGTCRLWEVETGNELHLIQHGSNNSGLAVAFHPKDETLAYSVLGGVVHFFDIRQGKVLERRILADRGEVNDIAFNADGTLMGTGTKQSGGGLWETATGKLLRRLRSYWVVEGISIHPDGKSLATADLAGCVHVWDAATGKPLLQNDGRPTAIAVDPNGEWFVTAGKDGVVRMRALPSGKPIREWRDHYGFGNLSSTIVTSPDGRMVAYNAINRGAERGYSVQVNDSRTGRTMWSLTKHELPVRIVVISPDSTLLASGSDDQTCRIWNLQSGKLLHELTGFAGTVTSVAFGPNSKLLATAAGGDLSVWNTATGKSLKNLRSKNAVAHLQFHPNGDSLIGFASAISIWKLSDWSLVRRPLFRPAAFGFGFNPAGSQIVATGYYGDVALYDSIAIDETMHLKIASPSGYANHVVFTPDGRHLLTANGNGTIYVLRLKEWTAD